MRLFDKSIHHDVHKQRLIDSAELVGFFGFPKVTKCLEIPEELLPFNMAMTEKIPDKKWIHFFLDDYQFERVWNAPGKYLPILKRFRGILGPDFSMFSYMPKVQQIYNCWRNAVLCSWLQREGIVVIPTVEWSDRESLGWCLSWVPKGSSIAVGTYGSYSSVERRRDMLKGLEYVCNTLNPYALCVYGKPDTTVESLCSRTVFFETYCQQLRKRA